MTLSERSVNKPTTVLMIFILLVAFGVYAMLNLPIDRFPEMDLPYIAVITTYENAGPEEVEQSVTRTLESSLSGVSGLKKLGSQSSTGSARECQHTKREHYPLRSRRSSTGHAI